MIDKGAVDKQDEEAMKYLAKQNPDKKWWHSLPLDIAFLMVMASLLVAIYLISMIKNKK